MKLNLEMLQNRHKQVLQEQNPDPHRGVGAGFYETFTLNLSMSSDEQNKAKVVSFGKDKND